MVLVKQEEVFPETLSKVAGVLAVFDVDMEEYEPYQSPFNTAGLGKALNVEKPDEDLKKFGLQMARNIKYTLHFRRLFECNVTGHYSSLENAATVNLPYLPYTEDKMKYLVQGRRCLLKLFRLPKTSEALKIHYKDHEEYIKAYNKRNSKQEEYDSELEDLFPAPSENTDTTNNGLPGNRIPPLTFMPPSSQNKRLTSVNVPSPIKMPAYHQQGNTTNSTSNNTTSNNVPNMNVDASGHPITEEDPGPTSDFVHRFAPLELSKEQRSRRTLEGFITQVKLKPTNIELSIRGWDICFEGKDIMEFHQMPRSEIVKEVIYSAGLIPLVDFTGMPDDIIDWKSSKDKGDAPFMSSMGDDCLTTDKMCVDQSLSPNEKGKTGDGTNYDSQASVGYAKPGTEYYNWARQFKDVQSLAKAFRSQWHYVLYADNRDNCADQTFNHGQIRGNCWDSARLFKCCCDAAGFPCVVLRGPGHAWNAIKVGNQWRTWDACRTSTIGVAGRTNGAGF